MLDPQFLRKNARWLTAGYLLALASSFGQTFFISLFAQHYREAFSLSHGELGNLYMAGTLASAVVMVQLGRLADHMRLVTLGTITIAGLAGACLFMSIVSSWWMLAIAFFLLRLFGQGMMSHTAVTAMARWFNAFRGRALGIVSLGYPTGEALLPALGVAIMIGFGWRTAWVIMAGVLIILVLPLLHWLCRRERSPQSIRRDLENADTGGVHWTRKQVLRDPVFYMLLPLVLSPSFIMTATFFNQAYLVETKGWSMAFWASCYPPYAAAAVAASLVCGWAIDRWSARDLLAWFLAPMAMALLVFAYGSSHFAGLTAMILFGLTAGATLTVVSALWVELYGTRHLGSIKALGTSVGVLATALGPGVVGGLLDLGVPLETQLEVMGYYAIAACFLLAMLRRHMVQKTVVA